MNEKEVVLVIFRNRTTGEVWVEAFTEFSGALTLFDKTIVKGNDQLNIPGVAYYKEDDRLEVRVMNVDVKS